MLYRLFELHSADFIALLIPKHHLKGAVVKLVLEKEVMSQPEEQIREAMKRYFQPSDYLIGVATRHFFA